MKTLNVTFEDEEFERLEDVKEKIQSTSWRMFILELAENYENKDR